MGPVWFIEGSAVAMAEITAAKLWASGKLPRWNNAPAPWKSLEERMSNKMKFMQTKKKECPSLLPDSYESECRQLAYDGGGWAIAYLMNRFGKDVLLNSFHPEVERLGWEEAFKTTFGQSLAEFVAELAGTDTRLSRCESFRTNFLVHEKPVVVVGAVLQTIWPGHMSSGNTTVAEGNCQLNGSSPICS